MLSCNINNDNSSVWECGKCWALILSSTRGGLIFIYFWKKNENEDWNIYGSFGGKRAGYKSPDFFREKKLTDTFPEAVQWYNKPLTCEMWDMWATVTDIIVVVLDLELSCQSPLPARLRHRPQLGGNNQHTIINWRANTLYQQLSSWHQKIKSPREKALKSLFTLNAKL